MQGFRNLLLIAPASILIIGVGLFAGPPKIEEVLSKFANYREWTRVNAHPAIMDPTAAIRCSYQPGNSIPVPGSDPHKEHFVTVYVNETGKRAMMEEGFSRFPEGSVIVKEKLSEELFTKGTPEQLTVMIKQKKGFNPKVGDWEFLAVSGDAKSVIQRGKLETCQSCHVTQAKQDYIYGTYKQN